MRPVNLHNIIVANKNISNDDLRDKLFKIWGVNPKHQELQSLEFIYDQLNVSFPNNELLVTNLLGGCYFGFKIPRISKEFDCLWIGKETIVNIELKSKEVGNDKIEKQLRQNVYYLRLLQKKLLLFTCDTSTGNCYSLDDSNNLITVQFKDLAKAIYDVHKEPLFNSEIENLFPPENYLVSPFNSTEDFINCHYFLTGQQNIIKKEVINFFNNVSGFCFYAITGGPGTGKTLLTYDIARTLMEFGNKVVIGHAGSLNEGHNKLNNNGWSILQTKDLVISKFIVNSIFGEFEHSFSEDADVFIIDEAQRCYNLQTIIDLVIKHGKKCIISYDPRQLMRDAEQDYNNENNIEKVVGTRVGTLTNTIRTNKYVYNYIKSLFNKNIPLSNGKNDCVEITYCDTEQELKLAENLLISQGYELPKFTPKTHGIEDYERWFTSTLHSAHAVIGQEFDKVAAVISPNMHYDDNGNLVSCKNYYYNEWRMLYQILSRARQKIHLIIFNNIPMLERCLKLLEM